jgi:hypothetical protein
MATGEDWTLMQKNSTTEYLNYEDKQVAGATPRTLHIP